MQKCELKGRGAFESPEAASVVGACAADAQTCTPTLKTLINLRMMTHIASCGVVVQGLHEPVPPCCAICCGRWIGHRHAGSHLLRSTIRPRPSRAGQPPVKTLTEKPMTFKPQSTPSSSNPQSDCSPSASLHPQPSFNSRFCVVNSL